MKPSDLARMCADAINSSNTTGSEPRISLKLPESKRASHTRYPWGKKGPKGIAVEFGFDGYDTVIFSAVDVLAYLAANGVVEIASEKGGGK